MKNRKNVIVIVLLLFTTMLGAGAKESKVEKEESLKTIETLYLFIHPVPYNEPMCQEYMPKWEKFIAQVATDEKSAICLIPNEPRAMKTLTSIAEKHFGNRCIADPDDYSDETKILLFEDVQRTLKNRGRFTQWIPYEMWTSINARRWTEGLKKDLRQRGLTYDPDKLQVITCGQEWGGCLTKYSMFMPKYLGLSKVAIIRPDLTPNVGFPFKATFVEHVLMGENVHLFLLKTSDGRPMAQFMDGLRAIWEPSHIATVPIDPRKVEVNSTTPNGYLKVQDFCRVLKDSIVADVGDGCRPAFTTIIGNNISYEDFRTALTKATISAVEDTCLPLYIPNYINNITLGPIDYGQ